MTMKTTRKIAELEMAARRERTPNSVRARTHSIAHSSRARAVGYDGGAADAAGEAAAVFVGAFVAAAAAAGAGAFASAASFPACHAS